MGVVNRLPNGAAPIDGLSRPYRAPAPLWPVLWVAPLAPVAAYWRPTRFRPHHG